MSATAREALADLPGEIAVRHGVAHHRDLEPHLAQDLRRSRRDVWLLPQPVRTAPTAITGLVLRTMVCSAPSSENCAPAAFTRAAWCMT